MENVSLIIENQKRAEFFAKGLKNSGINYDLFRPAGKPTAYKFVFKQKLTDKQEENMNALFDRWNDEQRS